jgi:hypothetical protein
MRIPSSIHRILFASDLEHYADGRRSTSAIRSAAKQRPQFGMDNAFAMPPGDVIEHHGIQVGAP